MEESSKRIRSSSKPEGWSDLPKDILRPIMEKLFWTKRGPYYLVCKNWHNCFKEIHQLVPWVMYFNDDDICKLYDPSTKRHYTVKEDAAIVKNKDFSTAQPCDSKYGCVLFSKIPIDGDSKMQHLFFYNPFTDEVIQLPELNIACLRAAFSLSPTSPDCTVIAFVSGRVPKIQTWRPGDNYWRMIEFEHDIISFGHPVYASDSFYCIFKRDRSTLMGLQTNLYLGAFNVKQQQWKTFLSPLPLSSQDIPSLAVAFNEDLLLFPHEQETSFWRLKLPEGEWVVLEHESLRKHLIYQAYKTPSFSIPVIENARECAKRLHNARDYIDSSPLRRIWIRPPFLLGSALLEQS